MEEWHGFNLFSKGMPYLDALIKTSEEGLEIVSHLDVEDLPFCHQPPIWVKELLAYPRVGRKIVPEIKDICSEQGKTWRLVDIDPEFQGYKDAALFVRGFDIEVKGNEVIVHPKKDGVLLVTKFYDGKVHGNGVDVETGIPAGMKGEGGIKYLWRQDNPRVGPIARYIPGFVHGFVDVRRNPSEPLSILVYRTH